jgi:hypothetical protein
LYQIRIPALRDYNMAHIRSGYSHEDMFAPEKAFVVANWYMNSAVPRYLKAFSIPDTPENRIIAWNWGIGNLRKHFQEGLAVPKESQDFIIKYNKLVNKGD